MRKMRARRRAEAQATEPVSADWVPPVRADGDTDAGLLVEWAEASLVVPVGLRQGKPFRLGDWQKAWLSDALADVPLAAPLRPPQPNPNLDHDR